MKTLDSGGAGMSFYCSTQTGEDHRYVGSSSLSNSAMLLGDFWMIGVVLEVIGNVKSFAATEAILMNLCATCCGKLHK